MKKGIITAALGLGMLYAQAAGANEMVRYDHALFVADARSSMEQTEPKQGMKKHKRHNHRHHHRHNHRHYRGSDCNRCGNAGMGVGYQGEPMMYEQQIEPHMDIMNRDHGTRGGARGSR